MPTGGGVLRSHESQLVGAVQFELVRFDICVLIHPGYHLWDLWPLLEGEELDAALELSVKVVGDDQARLEAFFYGHILAVIVV